MWCLCWVYGSLKLSRQWPEGKNSPSHPLSVCLLATVEATVCVLIITSGYITKKSGSLPPKKTSFFLSTLFFQVEPVCGPSLRRSGANMTNSLTPCSPSLAMSPVSYCQNKQTQRMFTSDTRRLISDPMSLVRRWTGEEVFPPVWSASARPGWDLVTAHYWLNAIILLISQVVDEWLQLFIPASGVSLVF